MLEDGHCKAVIVEIKRAENKEELNAKVEEVLTQIVDRSYDAPLRARPDITTIAH